MNKAQYKTARKLIRENGSIAYRWLIEMDFMPSDVYHLKQLAGETDSLAGKLFN